MELKQEYLLVDRWYGGNQEWLYKSNHISSKNADRSCGVAAAANMIQYLARKNPNYRNLYDGCNIEDYTYLMKDLYSILKPRFYGIPTIRKMENSIRKFANDRGVDLKSYSKRIVLNKEDASNFIKQALLEGYPVLLLTWNSLEPELKNHWVTVTGWQEIEGEEFMIVSNWGEKKSYSYTKWIKEKSIKGLLYLS